MAAKKRTEEGALRFTQHLREAKLDRGVLDVCGRRHVSLREIYFDTRGTAAIAARIEVWFWLRMSIKKTWSEIAFLFDRDATSAYYAIQRVEDHAKQNGIELTSHVIVGDIAQTMHMQSIERMRAGGRIAAARNNAKKPSVDDER